MSTGLLPLRILRPTAAQKHTGTVIFFHGSGAAGEECCDGITYVMRKVFSFPHLKVIFPTAPLQPYTPLGGELSNVWFDRVDIRSSVPECLHSVEKIKDEVMKLIKAENDEGIPNNRIIVGGISMGGALAFYTGLKWENSLGGIFTFSSFINENSSIYQHLRKSNKVPEILQFHGCRDDLVPLKSGKNTFDSLKSLGVNGNFLIDDTGEHMPNRRQLLQAHAWIENILP